MTVNPRQSFKLKLCLWILSVSLFTFLLIFSAGIYFSYQEVKTGVSNTVTSKLDYAVRALDEGLTNTEVSANNLLGVMASPFFDMAKTDHYVFCHEFLKANPAVNGVAIGYEESALKGHNGGFCPYIMRRGNGFMDRDLAETKNYREIEWYATAFAAKKPIWSKPYRESNGILLTTSYISPFYNSNGDIIGIAAVDLNLNVVSDSLQTLAPYAGSSLCIIDNDGKYVAHANRDLILSDAPQAIIDFINSNEEYYVDKSGKEEMYIFPAKEAKTGWTILLSIPRSSMTARTGKMLNAMFIDMLLGLLLLLGVCIVVISRLTKPLESFSEAAREIAHGNFNVDLPVIKDHNELYDLRAALSSMGVSLNEYVKQLEETSNKKASIERELSIARTIQMAMIPKIFPPYPERDAIDIYASLIPALAVGGDLYDFTLREDTLFFCIGDVSGKGVPASLLMAITRSLFRNNADSGKTPSQIATILNNALTENNEMSMFVTMFIASFNLKTGELRVCNCGHNMPATNAVVVDPQTLRVGPGEEYGYMKTVPTNIALGVMEGFDYEEIVMNVIPGSMLLLYTDGITEAENEAKELYGEDRLKALLESMSKDASSESIITALLADIKAFVGNATQSDDITALCMRYVKEEK